MERDADRSLCELHRIIDEVGDDLRHTLRIDLGEQALVSIELEGQPVAFSLGRNPSAASVTRSDRSVRFILRVNR